MDINAPRRVNGYSQGGTIVDGIAYFTANSYQEYIGDDGTLTNVFKSEGHPYVVAFEIDTLNIVRTYPFADTYDSTPLVIAQKDGTWLVLAHEHENARTVAMNRDTAEVEWISEANQPGGMFFGYSVYEKKDGTKLVLASVKNGLHAMSLETGEDEWFIGMSGGVTPCVDQIRGFIYFQTSGKIVKIDADSGEIVQTATVEAPSSAVCWNTIWVDDENGSYVATYWYSSQLYGSAIRVFDPELNLCWEKKGLPMSKKATQAYYGGVLFAGCGDHWQKGEYLNHTSTDWKKITAYHITSGEKKWELDLSPYSLTSVPNIIYCNGLLIAETQTNYRLGYHIFIIDASDGTLLQYLFQERPANSCGVPIFSGGCLFSGDLISDSVLVTTIGSGTATDWIGAYGNAQTNDMCASAAALSVYERRNGL